MGHKQRLLAVTVMGLWASAAGAEMRPSVNLIGNAGLIDMPTGEAAPDGFLTLQAAHMGPVLRFSAAFQFTPRLSGTFRYVGIGDWNARVCPPNCSGANSFDTYYDRNFDLSYQILTEGRWRAALSIGLIDFAGTGINSAEYLAATKTFGGRLKVTAGLGFGRLGSYNPVGSLGARAPIDVGKGGKLNTGQWFHGDYAVFGGVEYAVNDRWRVKAEYSSDAYAEEADRRGTFRRASPLNFGVEYHPTEAFQFGAYYMYGDQVGLSATVRLNPGQRPGGGVTGPAPLPIRPRGDWVTGTSEGGYVAPLQAYLDRDLGLTVESVAVSGDRVQVRYRSATYDAPVQAAGRIARALTWVMPPSVEVFELVPMENGMAAAQITLYRSNLEKLDGTLGAGDALLVRSHVEGAGPAPEGLVANPAVYPALRWSLLPAVASRTFDPRDPTEIYLGLRAAVRVEPAPGFVLSGSVFQSFTEGTRGPEVQAPSRLPHVRSSEVDYKMAKGAAIETLTAARYARLGPDLYGRITVGYLERMFGGISAEMLWRPEGRMWSLGAEANYVAQRDTDGGLGFAERDYRVATGHVSAYADFGRGYNLEVDVGRYLAGDVGATFTLTRDFANGWRVGGFATVTNASADDFGEGSFDKGVFLQIPTTWFTSRPSREARNVVLRPIQGDGGARLRVDGRLNETLRAYDAARIAADWGRVWK